MKSKIVFTVLLSLQVPVYSQVFELDKTNNSQIVKEKINEPIFQEDTGNSIEKPQEILFVSQSNEQLSINYKSNPIYEALVVNNFQLASNLFNNESQSTKIDGMNNAICFSALNNKSGFFDMIDLKKIDLSSPSCSGGDSPISLAAKHNDSKLLENLYKNQSKIKDKSNRAVKSKSEVLPLFNSVQYPNTTNNLEYLIGQNEPVNSTNKDGSTPLHYAAALGKEKHWNILVNAGADMYVKDKNGKTPIDYMNNNFNIYQLNYVYNTLPKIEQENYKETLGKIGSSVNNMRK